MFSTFSKIHLFLTLFGALSVSIGCVSIKYLESSGVNLNGMPNVFVSTLIVGAFYVSHVFLKQIIKPYLARMLAAYFGGAGVVAIPFFLFVNFSQESVRYEKYRSLDITQTDGSYLMSLNTSLEFIHSLHNVLLGIGGVATFAACVLLIIVGSKRAALNQC